jgi:Fe-S-cluster-containing dehydrogenase component
MDEDRRSFLKKAGGAAMGLSCGLPLFSVGCSELREGTARGESSNQLAMVIDVQKCLNDDLQRACIEACHEAHNVPAISDPKEEVKWIWSEDEYRHVFPDQAHAHTPTALAHEPILVLCNHCANPPCVRVCPTQATWKRKEDGIVMMDMHRCIGCRYCMAACPYGARSFNWRDPRETDENGAYRYFGEAGPPSDYPTRTRGVVEKCTFCAERLRDGGIPACVEAANARPDGQGALTFGSLADPDSDVSRLLREHHTICRRVNLGTGPNVYYLL